MKSETLHNNKVAQYMTDTAVRGRNRWRVAVWRKVKGMWRKRRMDPTKKLYKMRKEWVGRI